MRLLHYLELQNFKRFGDQQRIELDHPTVLIGPNNCGKTTAIQAIALWSQAVKTWIDKKGKTTSRQRTATSLNRLNIVSVPVQRTRYFWHNAAAPTVNEPIPLQITLGVWHENRVEPVTMRFRNQGDDLVYCTPDEDTLPKRELLEVAAAINVALLYPMSGLETEEPVLQPGRIDVLLGQGQTAQVLRNLCLSVHSESNENWQEIVDLMERLFAVQLGEPRETVRGSIDLFYQQEGVKERLDVALAGRGFQQMLLVLAYLYFHRRSVLLIDEPDAHLEILRQKQVYVLLRDIADRNESQIVLATHSEAILTEAEDRNLTLLLAGRANNLADQSSISDTLKYCGTEHYVRARQCGYVLYVEGRTDRSILRALANKLEHKVSDTWDKGVNIYYVQNIYPQMTLDAELERVEKKPIKKRGGQKQAEHFVTEHFRMLQSMVPHLKGLAILDSDDQAREDTLIDDLHITYWNRYEVENYFITPQSLEDYASQSERSLPLFQPSVQEVLNILIQECVSADPSSVRLAWKESTERIKLSDFAEEFFRRLAHETESPMLLRKGDLYRLVDCVDSQTISAEVGEKLDLLQGLFEKAQPEEEVA